MPLVCRNSGEDFPHVVSYIYIYIFLPFSYFLMVCFNVKGDTVGSLAADTEREVSWGLRCLLGINCCESKREGGYRAEGKFRA